MSISEQVVLDFIKRNLDYSEFPSQELANFKELVTQGNDIAAAKEYCEKTGAKLDEAHLAVFTLRHL